MCVLSCSLLSRQDIHVPADLLCSGFGDRRSDLGARNFMLRAHIAMWGAPNRVTSCPKELWASVFEALEVSETLRGGQESLKEIPKCFKVTIHRACRVIMSSPGGVTDIDPASTGRRWGFGPPSTGVIFSVDVVP